MSAEPPPERASEPEVRPDRRRGREWWLTGGMYTLVSVSVGVAAAQFWRSIGKAAGGTPEWFSHWIIGFLAGVGGFLMAFALLWERWQDNSESRKPARHYVTLRPR